MGVLPVLTVKNPQTSLSMLQGMRDHNPLQWNRFVQLFGPLVYGWCRKREIPEHDAADIVQDVFLAVAKQIDHFRKECPSDTFCGWLRRITQHKVADHFRQRAKHPSPLGGSTAQVQMNHVEMEATEIWTAEDVDQENQALYRRALALLEDSFEPRTWQAFWKTVIEDQNAHAIATELKMTVGAVYNAKYKVLRKLRTELGELL